jgi:glyoxylase-like metal-dependent hydrolase (beta-lactamase superfamily II)
MNMLNRRYLFPNVIELNYQAGRKLGVNVYLLDGGDEFAVLDIGYEEAVPEVVDLIRKMDFNLAKCKYLIATHADADHVQGLARARELFKSRVAAHPLAIPAIEAGDVETTFARITAQGIDMPMPPVKVDLALNDGDVLTIGKLKLEVWHTPGHTPGQLSFKTGELLFVGDNIYKDGCVGVIDAHHGSDIPAFINSLKRIRGDDSKFLLPSHGPAFKRDDKQIKKTIDRLVQYQHMADFGTCAVDWPLLDEWEKDVLSGKLPKFKD